MEITVVTTMISNECEILTILKRNLNSFFIFQFFFQNEAHFLFNLFIAKSNVGNQNKKASMMFLSKEASNKDQQLKAQMFASFQDDESETLNMCRRKVTFLMIIEVI